MYPEGCLINPEGNIIVVFEKDLSNPNYEGFIEFWEIINIGFNSITIDCRFTFN